MSVKGNYFWLRALSNMSNAKCLSKACLISLKLIIDATKRVYLLYIRKNSGRFIFANFADVVFRENNKPSRNGENSFVNTDVINHAKVAIHLLSKICLLT